VRRITIGRLLNKHSQFAYKKLLNFALEVQDEGNQKFGANNVLPKQRVVFTYKDRDGDVITITTRDEFLEAWEHVGGSVMRVTASYRNLRNLRMNGNNSGLGADSIRASNLKEVMETVFALMTNVLAMIQKALGALVNHVERIEFQSEPCEPRVNVPLREVAPRSASVDKQAQDFGDRIVTQARVLHARKKKSQKLPKAKSESKVLDPNFSHWRHTCDGCGVTPIVGLRYHAMNRPDFDYCQGCYKLHGDDDEGIVFEPRQLVRDKHYQKLKRAKVCKKGVQRKAPVVANESAFDKDIKVAIERSLKDCVPNTEVVAQKVEETCKVQMPPMKEDDPDSFHTAQDLKEIESFIDTTIDSVNSFVSGVLTELSDNLIDDFEKDCGEDVPKMKEHAEVEVHEDLKEVEGVREDSSVGPLEVTGVVGSADALEVSVQSDEMFSVDINEDSKPPSQSETPADIVPEINAVTESRAYTAADADSEEEVDIEQGLSSKENEADVIIVEAEELEVTSVRSRSSSGESWDMCGEDEAMARAASAIGSALFEQSDIVVQSDDSTSGIVLSHDAANAGDGPSGDDESTSSDGSSISSHTSSSKSSKSSSSSSSSSNLSSSSSSLSSESSSSSESSKSSDHSNSSWSAISGALIERWDKELKELAEVGFTDVAKCVEALESLTAANIGCDRDEPVTLHQAVDYLLKHAE